MPMIKIPGAVLNMALASDITMDPDASGYEPTLGRKLTAASGGRGATVDLTEAEADDLAEFVEAMLLGAKQSGERGDVRACRAVLDQIAGA